jgi:2-oxoglutarate ferredoxin oxidoreductase subunit alpha
VIEDIYREFFVSLSHCLVVEQSHQGQLHKIIRMWVDVPKDFASYAKSGANPIAPEDLIQKIHALAKA